VPAVPNTYSEFTRQLCSEMLNKNPNARPSAEDILQRPKIQGIMRQMLDEAHASQVSKSSEGSQASSKDAAETAADEEVEAVTSGAAQAKECAGGPYADAAGHYKKNDCVEYRSVSHKDWLPAIITDADGSGYVMINLKPGVWISQEDQAVNVRPSPRPHRRNDRSVSVVERKVPRTAAYAPLHHRMQSPSSAGVVGRRPSSPPRLEQFGKPPSPVLLRHGSASSQANSPSSAANSRMGTPHRSASPAPDVAARGPRPGSPPVRPPFIPRSKSPLYRHNSAAAAAGAAIASGAAAAGG
jgi:hypothetical protein